MKIIRIVKIFLETLTMKWYHGTTEDNWKTIQKEGILFGRRFVVDNDGKPIKEISRCTYLAADLDEAKKYGNVILQVEYNPLERPKNNNYVDGCWQMRVYEPIPIENVKQII